MVWFVGAQKNKVDFSEDFHSTGLVSLFYDREEAKYIFKIFERIQAGDLVVIKSYSVSNGLYIKGVGICTDSTLYHHEKLRSCKKVFWLWKGNENLGRFNDYLTSFRTGAVHVEENEDILKRIVQLISTSK